MTLSTGKIRGGCRFGKGTLQYLLRKPSYVGEVNYKGSLHKGEPKPIVDQSMFDAVQKLLTNNATERKLGRPHSNSLLTDLLFDDSDNRMTPSFSRKQGARYRYYVSLALLQSWEAEAESVTRVTAPEIEENAVTVLRANNVLLQQEAGAKLETLQNIVERVELREIDLQITLVNKSAGKEGIVSVHWQKKLMVPIKARFMHQRQAPNSIARNSRHPARRNRPGTQMSR